MDFKIIVAVFSDHLATVNFHFFIGDSKRTGDPQLVLSFVLDGPLSVSEVSVAGVVVDSLPTPVIFL